MRRRHGNQKGMFMLGVFAGLICVMTVGYAAFSTTLNIKVKGNIGSKDLTPADLIKNVVDSGDGLYKDTYEENRYIFRGANPNNYITFNNETWRIIALEQDTESSGKYNLKIMKKDSIGEMAWDTSNSNNWSRPATLNTYLNEEYYNGLSSDTKSLIKEHIWNIGAVTYNNSDLTNAITEEKANTLTNKVALPTLTEYVRASTNSACTSVNEYYITPGCYENSETHNWMFNVNMWLLSAYMNYNDCVAMVNDNGRVSNGGRTVNITFGTRPALYLTSNITLEGEGTEDKPYTIVS